MRLAVLALIAATSPALAQTKVVSYTTTCAKVQAAVARTGSALVTYSPSGYNNANVATALMTLGNYGWDRVVADARYCLPRQELTPIWAPTRDNPQCFAGYTCSEDGGSGGRRSR